MRRRAQAHTEREGENEDSWGRATARSNALGRRESTTRRRVRRRPLALSEGHTLSASAFAYVSLSLRHTHTHTQRFPERPCDRGRGGTTMKMTRESTKVKEQSKAKKGIPLYQRGEKKERETYTHCEIHTVRGLLQLHISLTHEEVQGPFSLPPLLLPLPLPRQAPNHNSKAAFFCAWRRRGDAHVHTQTHTHSRTQEPVPSSGSVLEQLTATATVPPASPLPAGRPSRGSSETVAVPPRR